MSQELRITEQDLGAAEVLWEFHCVYDTPRPADAIIGLGSYDLRVADWCAELYLAGFAPFILFTGSAGNWTRDLYGMTEAEAFAQRAEKAGVPADAVLLEKRATNIGENLRFARAILPTIHSAIIATKPQTQRRCQATLKHQWARLDAMITAPLIRFREQPTEHHGMQALICEMVGDIWRMNAYPARGFQSEHPVPESVERAFAYLVGRGYTAHIPDEK
ncbi:YdcF family protein [Oricola cellulosilytica]|uniref:YdcF family protein n=1 Tax=Oricola cellulosilytica TaxID=1429082 RepID=A0A4R0PAU7_9HYPH|nr:YdcF family protein [Oricola cellulosilytica]TCD14361.1 YdcF family protein [Oricola cellulosilytica]